MYSGKIAAVGLFEEKKNENNREVFYHNQHIVCGQHAKKAIQYADWLVTTIKNSIRDSFWPLPQPHSCTLKFKKCPLTK